MWKRQDDPFLCQILGNAPQLQGALGESVSILADTHDTYTGTLLSGVDVWTVT